MREGEAFNKQIKLIYDHLTAIKNTAEDSINHKEQSNVSYPLASKRYNRSLKQVKKLSRHIPRIADSLADFSKYEEKDFLIHGNYTYAVRLLADAQRLRAILKNLMDDHQ